METSHNVLKIEAMQFEVDRSRDMIKIKARLLFKICFLCPITGNKYKELCMSSFGLDYSEKEALRKSVENFFQGKSEHDKTNTYDCKINCRSDFENIHHIDLNDIPEPYKTMFQDLFSTLNWNISKALPLTFQLPG